MKKLKRILCLMIIIPVGLFLIIWGISVLRCEILTYSFHEVFEEKYKDNTMLGELEYLKVLSCAPDVARVYFVTSGENCIGGDILIFENKDGVWNYSGWEETVWSSSGSADGFIWPYGR